MSKFSFIVNPAAGKVKSSGIIKKLNQLETTDPSKYKIHITKQPYDATKITKEILNASHSEIIVAVGGDGTVNEVVNGFDHNLEVLLGVLPFGSGNDISRTLYKKRTDILEVLIDEKKRGIVQFDMCSAEIVNSTGEVIKKKFINAVGVGFDSYVAYLNQYEKIFTGITSYLIAVIKALKAPIGIDMNIAIDDKGYQSKLLLATIGNGKTSGGGFYLNPDADPTDGILNITAVEKLTIPQIIRKLPLTLLNKTERVKQAKFFKGQNISMELKSPYYVHLDGEIPSQNAIKINIKIDGKINIIKEV